MQELRCFIAIPKSGKPFIAGAGFTQKAAMLDALAWDHPEATVDVRPALVQGVGDLAEIGRDTPFRLVK